MKLHFSKLSAVRRQMAVGGTTTPSPAHTQLANLPWLAARRFLEGVQRGYQLSRVVGNGYITHESYFRSLIKFARLSRNSTL
jgi:hypothetical protein